MYVYSYIYIFIYVYTYMYVCVCVFSAFAGLLRIKLCSVLGSSCHAVELRVLNLTLPGWNPKWVLGIQY